MKVSLLYDLISFHSIHKLAVLNNTRASKKGSAFILLLQILTCANVRLSFVIRLANGIRLAIILFINYEVIVGTMIE